MESLPQLHHHQPPRFSVNLRRLSVPKPIVLRPSFKLKPIRASSSPILRTTCIAIASTALFFTRLHHKPAIGAPVTAPMVEPSKESAASYDEQEQALEEHLREHPGDIQALRSLAEVRIQATKIEQAIGAIDLLIELQPDKTEWPLMKYHLYTLSGELESARQGFEQLLEKDPLLIQPYIGLVALGSDQDPSLKELGKRVEMAMERCKKERSKADVRDFKFLIAQLKVIEKNYNDALKMYQELVKEDPDDFRPYLCQGIIYSLLKKTHLAEEQFQNYRRLVPQNHPYAQYFDDGVIANRGSKKPNH